MNKHYSKLRKWSFLASCLMGFSAYGQVATTFNYTGEMQTFVVPAGVTEVQFDVKGAEGGDAIGTTVGWGGTSTINADAGNGGRVTGLLPVTPGETLYLFVGGEGVLLSGGYNGGGDADFCSGTEVIASGGGGASDIRQGGTSLADRTVVAGGGGGAAGNGADAYRSSDGAGAGGGLIGQAGLTLYGGGTCLVAQGGSAVAGGTGGNNSCWCGGGMVAGSGSLGLGGSSICAPSGLSTCSCSGTGCTSGGGGGGGFYGGGAGICYSGGAGGSSYTTPSATDVVHTQGANEGHGQIIITVLCNPLTVTVSDYEICLGESFTLNASGDGTISWDMGVENGVAFEPVTTGITTYSASSDLGTDCVFEVAIEVFELPTVTISSDDTEICDGDAVVIDFGGDADTYTWTPADLIEGDAYVPDLGLTAFTLTGTDDVTGCQNVAIVEVLVHELPIVSANVDDDKICIGEGYTATGGGAATYEWTPADVIDGEVNTPISVGLISLTVVGTDVNGCVNSASAEVEVAEAIEITYTTTDELLGFDGTIDATVTGGFMPYSFDWDNDATGDFDDTEDLLGLTEGTYVLVVQDSEGCDNTITVDLNGQVGIETNQENGFTVYPNPTTNQITIRLNGNFTYEVLNLNGEVILNGSGLNQKMVDLESIASGVYFVHVKNADFFNTIKIVKK